MGDTKVEGAGANEGEGRNKEAEEILAACLGEGGAQAQARVEAACQAHPALAEVLRDRLARLMASGLLGAAGDQPPAPKEAHQLGRFQLLRVIGRGGMGEVWLARDPNRGLVAVKLIREELLASPVARARFEREIQAASSLQHPNIVRVFPRQDAPTPCLAMEWVPGCTLAEVLAEVSGGQLSTATGAQMFRVVLARTQAPAPEDLEPSALYDGTWADACVRVALAIASALSHAHEHDIVHRDLKPSNVMITPDGRVKLLDFGLVRVQASVSLTRTGIVVGTPRYMAPEQLRGDAAGPRADVFSLGATLYELLTARPAFAEASAESGRFPRAPVSLRRLNPSVSRDLETVCLQAMDPVPARRYPTADSLAQDLVRVLERRPVVARRPGVGTRVLRWTRRHPTWAVALAAVALVALISGYWVRERLHTQRLDAQARTLAATRFLNRDDPATLHLALEGAEGLLDVESRSVACQALATAHAVRTVRTEGRGVNDVAVSADGRVLALGCGDGAVLVDSLYEASPQPVRQAEPPDPKKFVKAVRVLSDGRVVVAGPAGRAQLWDPVRDVVTKLDRHTQEVCDIAVDAHEQRLALASHDRAVSVWSIPIASLLYDVQHQGAVYAVRFSPDGRLLATGSEDMTVRVWDAATGKLIQELECVPSPMRGACRSISFSPDGQWLGAAFCNGVARIFDTATWSPTDLRGHSREEVMSIELWQTDGMLHAVTACFDRTVRHWRILIQPDGERGPGAVQSTELTGHTGFVRWARPSSNGERVLTVGDDLTARVFDTRLDLQVAVLRHRREVSVARFANDSSMVVTGDAEAAHVWRLDTNIKVHPNEITSMVLSQDARGLATTSMGRQILVLDAENLTRRAQLAVHEPVTLMAWCAGSVVFAGSPANATDPSGAVVTIWNPSTGRTARSEPYRLRPRWIVGLDGAVVTGAGKELRCIDPDTGATTWTETIADPGHDLNVATSSHDGKRLLTCVNRTAKLRRYDAVAQRLDTEAEVTADSEIMAAVFAPDGKRIVLGDNQQVYVFDRDGSLVKTWKLPGSEPGVYALACHPEAPLAVAGTTRGDAWLLNDSNQSMTPLPTHTAAVFHAEFSADGSVALTVSRDGSAAVWEVPSGELRLVLGGTRGTLTQATLTGGFVIAGFDDGTIQRYPIARDPVPALQARTRHLRGLETPR